MSLRPSTSIGCDLGQQTRFKGGFQLSKLLPAFGIGIIVRPRDWFYRGVLLGAQDGASKINGEWPPKCRYVVLARRQCTGRVRRPDQRLRQLIVLQHMTVGFRLHRHLSDRGQADRCFSGCADDGTASEVDGTPKAEAKIEAFRIEFCGLLPTTFGNAMILF